jgi:hypothetical protein
MGEPITEGPLRVDAVEKLSCQVPGIYRSYEAACAATASGMLTPSKMRSREFFNSIGQAVKFADLGERLVTPGLLPSAMVADVPGADLPKLLN